MFEKNLEIGYLLDFYGEILSERKRDIMDLYYNDDLSLSEIAEQMGITRQAVRDSIKKTEQELFFYEEKLGLRRRLTEAETRAETALALCRAASGAVPPRPHRGAGGHPPRRSAGVNHSLYPYIHPHFSVERRKNQCFRVSAKSWNRPLRNSAAKAP